MTNTQQTNFAQANNDSSVHLYDLLEKMREIVSGAENLFGDGHIRYMEESIAATGEGISIDSPLYKLHEGISLLAYEKEGSPLKQPPYIDQIMAYLLASREAGIISQQDEMDLVGELHHAVTTKDLTYMTETTANHNSKHILNNLEHSQNPYARCAIIQINLEYSRSAVTRRSIFRMLLEYQNNPEIRKKLSDILNEKALEGVVSTMISSTPLDSDDLPFILDKAREFGFSDAAEHAREMAFEFHTLERQREFLEKQRESLEEQKKTLSDRFSKSSFAKDGPVVVRKNPERSAQLPDWALQH
ncbi:MAG: hypothetical protein KDJ75_05815 [Alphaproteobacteria bacterium]|nr:hypothetical protein [Alphaproteobacteria bacterium]